jgi:hypothetical protein
MPCSEIGTIFNLMDDFPIYMAREKCLIILQGRFEHHFSDLVLGLVWFGLIISWFSFYYEEEKEISTNWLSVN